MRARPVAGLLIAMALAACVFGGTAQASHVACGETLTQDTTLDSDLANCPTVGLVIGADGVDLDLAGHTISAGPDAYYGIEARVKSGLRVHDGTVVGFRSFGLLMSDVTDSDVTRLVVSARFNGIYFTGDSDRNRIERNAVTGLDGIEVNDDSDANVIARNSVIAGIDGITLEYGFRNRMQHNRVEHNHINAVSEVLRVDGNDDVVIAHNVIDRGGRGMVVGSGSNITIRKNQISGTGQGITFYGARESRLEKNVVSDSRLQGIIVYVSSGVVVSHNVALRNGTVGIHQPNHGPPNGPVTFTHNVSNENGALGIEVQPTAIDGGHNRASANGDPRQCVNVACR